jgi:phosphate-selective porin OprO/OprP
MRLGARQNRYLAGAWKLCSVLGAIAAVAVSTSSVRAQSGSSSPALSEAPAFVDLTDGATSAALPAPISTAAGTAVPAPAAAAPADPANLELRVRELEDVIRQMQAQQSPNIAVPASATAQDPLAPPDSALPPEPAPAFNPIGSEGQANQIISQSLGPGGFAGWRDNGIYIESGDKNFLFRITGQIQEDYREFLRTKDRTDIDTFLLRRARFGLEATLYKYYEFRFLPDFGQNSPIIQDAYLNVHYCDELQFEIGRFKQPISYEQLIQDRYVPTLERSLIDQLVPARDLGAMVHGENMFANRFDYAASISNGEINGDNTDLNNHKDFDARISARPLNDPDNYEWLRYFGIGVSGGFGIEQEPINPSTLRTPDTVPFLVYNSTVRANGLRTRLCPELTYFYGPFGFLAQYYDEHQDMSPVASGHGSGIVEDVPMTGYVFLGTAFLTGETRTTYSQQIAPVRNFDPRHPISCPGAWELVGRVSHLDVGDIIYSKGIADLANPATTANVATEYTLGFNWYFNAFVRMQFNYEHDMFNRSVLLGSSTAANELRSQDSLFTRFQVIF